MKEQIIKILESYIVDNIGETSPKIDIDSIPTIADEILALQLQQTGVMPRFISLVTSFDFNSINEKIDWLGIKREDIISLQHTKNDGFCLYYFKNEA